MSFCTCLAHRLAKRPIRLCGNCMLLTSVEDLGFLVCWLCSKDRWLRGVLLSFPQKL